MVKPSQCGPWPLASQPAMPSPGQPPGEPGHRRRVLDHRGQPAPARRPARRPGRYGVEKISHGPIISLIPGDMHGEIAGRKRAGTAAFELFNGPSLSESHRVKPNKPRLIAATLTGPALGREQREIRERARPGGVFPVLE